MRPAEGTDVLQLTCHLTHDTIAAAHSHAAVVHHGALDVVLHPQLAAQHDQPARHAARHAPGLIHVTRDLTSQDARTERAQNARYHVVTAGAERGGPIAWPHVGQLTRLVDDDGGVLSGVGGRATGHHIAKCDTSNIVRVLV
eukprot:GHVL01037650.1.p2 GENE.GHVL01037650.1~~GHVL01037650.1.p2  ORF type:complete len:142 (-),score=11.03 GHVL01037650.1:157-582(-)